MKVTVFNTSGKKRTQINAGNVETWGELKKVLEKENVETKGKRAIIGENQVTLESTKAVLPKGLDIRGKVTDDFTLFLTPIKVKSGSDYIDVNTMGYKECKKFIKDIYAASDEAKAYFGNYTQKTTEAMKTLIKGWLEANSEPVPKEAEDVVTATFYVDEAIKNPNMLKAKLESGCFNNEEVVDEVEELTAQWEEIKANL